MRKRCCVVLLVSGALAACFYPPARKPPAARDNEIILALPYDLAWDTVQKVIAENAFRTITQNPDSGVVEAQAIGGFTLRDADCGRLKGIAGKYNAEPDPNSSAVYDFYVKPRGGESTVVSVQATFSTPLHIPLHPPSYAQCVSHGIEEAHLLKEISRAALQAHRPQFQPPRPVPPESRRDYQLKAAARA